jgi:hypothetical protein
MGLKEKVEVEVENENQVPSHEPRAKVYQLSRKVKKGEPLHQRYRHRGLSWE